ncbi:hypothetical protein [Ferrovum sp.]|uniref:hypothetical protein n=1 Tax=Ferrovum sp. TaxID=2609467 RepID=UPI002629F553|nr:hypothetical protein [Ferrovum sp.]
MTCITLLGFRTLFGVSLARSGWTKHHLQSGSSAHQKCQYSCAASAFSYLRRLPAEIIKIDQVFIRDMLHDPEDLSIVQGGHWFGSGIPQGCAGRRGWKPSRMVENFSTWGVLWQQQGFGIARPMKVAGVPDWIRTFMGFPEEPSLQ